jgi:glucosamine-6-phosphate deaminase
MYTNLFAHIDIVPSNVHILNGCAPDLGAECAAYEASIESHGGIDLFLGGVGADGHIAFNEPGSSLSSLTRVKSLVPETIIANARFFNNDESKVPRMALTVGVGTIMNSKEVAIIATGAGKAQAIKAGVEGNVNHWWTITKLQEHRSALFVVDEAACGMLMLNTVNVGSVRWAE